MHLLFLSNLYPPCDLGGYEQVCREVAQSLKARGHDVHILTSRYGVTEKIVLNEPDITRTLFLETNLEYYRPLDFFHQRVQRERANKEELRRCIEAYQPDLVVVWGMWQLPLRLPALAEKMLPGRVVYYIASYWPTDLDPHTEYWQLPATRPLTEMLKRPLRAFVSAKLRREGYPPKLLFDHAVCCSRYVKERLVEEKQLTDKADVIYIGIDPTPFEHQKGESSGRDTDTLQLLYFGRLNEDKGVHTAIEAISYLKRNGQEKSAHLTILGDGHPDYKRRLQQMVAEFDIGEQVTFAGKISRDEIPNRIRGFDVFLFTSIWAEPFGRTIIEGMLAGLVVIGSDVGGSRELFEKYDSQLLFRPDDAAGLADRILTVASDLLYRRRLQKLGRQIAMEQFTLSAMVEKFERYLLKITGASSV